MDQNLPCAQLGAARSRQDESKEAHGAGPKRLHLGCAGVHAAWCTGPVSRLLLPFFFEKKNRAGFAKKWRQKS
jgi:hypothetical protein